MSELSISNLRLQATPAGGVFYFADGSPLTYVPDGVEAVRRGALVPDELKRQKVGDVVVAAMPINAPLILSFLERARERRIRNLYLSPPASASSPVGWLKFPAAGKTDVVKQEAVLLLNRQHKSLPSLGGVRLATWVDEITYRASEMFAGESCPLWRDLEPVIVRHPGWPALTFAASNLQVYAARLLTLINDPRWYVDTRKPDATKKLVSAFGLGLEGYSNMQPHVRDVDLPRGRNSIAAEAVLDTWYSGDEGEPTLDDVLPQSFPWRVYYGADDPVEGLCFASRVLLKMVCDVWLDHLTPSRVYETTVSVNRDVGGFNSSGPRLRPAKRYSPQLFVPEHHFQPGELGRWQGHVEHWRREHWQLA